DVRDEGGPALERLWQTIAEGVPAPQRRRIWAGCHSLDAVRFFAGTDAVNILGFIPAPEDAVAFWAAGATIIRLWERDVSAERVAELRGLGADIWVTTGGPGTAFAGGDSAAANLRHLAKTGIGGVLVNDVKLAVDIMETMK